MNQNFNEHNLDKPKENHPFQQLFFSPELLPPEPLPRDTSEGEETEAESQYSSTLNVPSSAPLADSALEIFSSDSPVFPMKEMNRYIDKQYKEYIEGKEDIPTRAMSIISSEVNDRPKLLYSAYREGKLLNAKVDICHGKHKYLEEEHLLVTRTRAAGNVWIELRDKISFNQPDIFAPQRFDLKKNVVCILFIAEGEEASNLRSNTQTLKENKIPFILVGSTEQEGKAFAKELGAVLFIEWDHQQDDSDNLERLLNQVVMVANLNEKERELYQRTYWAELEYQGFIRAKNDAANILLDNLSSYIQDYGNNPAEKFRDVLVSSTLFQSIVPPAKKAEHKTEDNKKNAALKLRKKLEFDMGRMASLDVSQEESNFTLAQIDALLEGTLSRIVGENASVYDWLVAMRDKLEYDQNYPNAAERNYQSFIGNTRDSQIRCCLLADLERHINCGKGTSAQQNRNPLVSSVLFRPFTTPVAAQTEADISKSAAEKLVSMLKSDWDDAKKVPRKLLNAEKQQFTIQELEVLCNSQTKLGKIVACHEKLRELFLDMRHKKFNQLQQTQSAQPPKDSELFGSFSRK